MNEIEQPAPSAPEPQSLPAESATTAADDLDGLLETYDQEVGTAKPGSTTQPSPSAETPVSADQVGEELRRDLDLTTLRTWAEGVDAERQAEMHRRSVEMDKQDFGRIEKAAKDAIAETGIPLPDSYASMWLKNELTINAELYHKLTHRYDSEEATKNAERVTLAAIKRLREEVKRFPDRTATEDREVVAAAVRGMNGKAPVSAPKNYSRMNDKEFSANVESDFGFNPGW